MQGLRPVYPMAVAALWLCAGSLGFEVIDHVSRKVSSPINGSSGELTLLEGGMLGLGLASTVPYLIWKYRVMQNAARIDPAGVTISPAMAVGCYFIPFVNLYLPCKAMAQAAKASTGTAKGVAAWWSTQIGSFLFGMLIGFAESFGDSARPGMLTDLYTIFSVVTVVAAWKLIMSITRAQMAGRPAPA